MEAERAIQGQHELHETCDKKQQILKKGCVFLQQTRRTILLGRQEELEKHRIIIFIPVQRPHQWMVIVGEKKNQLLDVGMCRHLPPETLTYSAPEWDIS